MISSKSEQPNSALVQPNRFTHKVLFLQNYLFLVFLATWVLDVRGKRNWKWFEGFVME